jgi:2-methylcitrate dehydratase PrpD
MTGPPDTAAYPSQALAQFAAALRYEQIPPAVVGRTQELFLDWIGSALAGRGAAQTRAFERFADAMGPAAGPAEVLTSRRTTSPLFAAMINAAASHVAEQDDVHSGSVFHPGAVVFPPALATAQALRRSGRDFIAAAVAGYEVGIRVGEFLGRTHYEVFHTTGTAGAFAAAAAVGNLLRLDGEAMLHAFGSAGTQAAGLWEFLRDGADSKQLHTAKAAANGLLAANLAGDGFAGARQILEGKRGLAAGMSRDADPARLTDRLGSRWATAETSFKYHASCRHTHPAADALLDVMDRTGVGAEEVAGVVAHVHQGAIDVLGTIVEPTSVHLAKFSMGTVLGMVAVFGSAGVVEFDDHFSDSRVAAFRRLVEMRLDPEVDAAYPRRWIGKVTVETVDGRRLEGRVDEPKGDPGNPLSRAELEDKFFRLARYREGATKEEAGRIVEMAWGLPTDAVMGPLFR